jgi:RES domain-containing protein
VILWRIAAETRKYSAEDISGAGASISPGRWNGVGEPVVYAAEAISLCVLETVAHLDDAGLPLHRFLIEITVPDSVWAQREFLDVPMLPPTWSAVPAGKGSVDVGSAWLAKGGSPILRVPSVIVPEDFVSLINPKHPAASGITAKAIRPFTYDALFRSRP